MQDEMQALKQNQVYELVEAPKNCTLVSNKWVFKIKLGADGNVQKYRARLVPK